MKAVELSDQFAHSAVPAAERVPGWRVALIVASFSIGLPDFLNASQIGLALGLRQAILAALLAGLFLCAGAALTATVAVRTRLATYALIERSFGRAGAALINSVIAAIHFCWFGVNAALFGQALAAAAAANGLAIGTDALVIVGAVLMAGATTIGFRAIDRLASVAVPVLAVVLGTLAVLALRQHGLVLVPAAHPPEPMRFGIAASALAGGNMLALATMPDLARFIRSERGAVGAMALSFPLAAPLMMTVSAIPALAFGETSLAALVTRLGLCTPVLFLLVLPTLTVNAQNLYSASLALSTTFGRVRRAVFIVAGAAIGTALALGGIVDAFIPFLLLLGVLIPPIAAIYVIDNLAFGGAAPGQPIAAIRWQAVLAWCLAVATALALAHANRSPTTIPALDATVMAAIAYFALTVSRARARG